MVKLSVIGTGYVGLVAGACFADAGNSVICVDIDQKKIDDLKKGILPIYEPGLKDIVDPNFKSGRLQFTTDLKLAVETTDLIFIAVGTPESEDGSADLTHVLNVATSIATLMNGPKSVVLKSTVPVGTADKVRAVMMAKTKFDFDIINNPEFLKEGAAVDDFLRPDRVVIGCTSDKAKDLMKELYIPFVKNGRPILFMDNKSAELTKYAANCFLATKISFINELALLADELGADIEAVKKGFTSDSRVNPAFFYPGVGYGGSCFPKDVKALIHMGETLNSPMHVMNAVDQANERQKSVLFEKFKNHFGNISGMTVAMWGIAFKPRTDDIRDAPAFTLIEKLIESGCRVNAYDPVALENARARLKNPAVRFVDNAYAALEGADTLMIVTEWNEFRNPDFQKIKSSLKSSVIFDGRNVFDPLKIKELGFKYFSIGRDSVVRDNDK